MELIDCVDGLLAGPRPDWTPDDDSQQAADVPDTGVDVESQVM